MRWRETSGVLRSYIRSACRTSLAAQCGPKTRRATSAGRTRLAISCRSCSIYGPPNCSACCPNGHRSPIASCGNAAIAAATLAASAGWPINVFVPTWMDDAVGKMLASLDARVSTCERVESGPPGDPTLHRFREAVADGAIPFTVQGPENGYCLDGGRTIGWELAEQLETLDVAPAVVYVQVGGGAFAACLSQGLNHGVPLVAVQAEGAAPLDAALQRAAGREHPERQWADMMRPWPHPHSVADGILDDETYDWLAVRAAIDTSGGRSLVVAESKIEEAHAAAQSAGFNVSPTGSAGLAGALTELQPEQQQGPVLVVMSGVAR